MLCVKLRKRTFQLGTNLKMSTSIHNEEIIRTKSYQGSHGLTLLAWSIIINYCHHYWDHSSSRCSPAGPSPPPSPLTRGVWLHSRKQAPDKSYNLQRHCDKLIISHTVINSHERLFTSRHSNNTSLSVHTYRFISNTNKPKYLAFLQMTFSSFWC